MKKIVMIIMEVALIALPTMAQDWQSTSAMQGTGSNYSSQVTEVGATGVDDMATTTEGYSPAKAPGGPRRSFDNTSNPGQGNPGSPIGDAVLPLILMAMLFAGVVYARRKKALKR